MTVSDQTARPGMRKTQHRWLRYDIGVGHKITGRFWVGPILFNFEARITKVQQMKIATVGLKIRKIGLLKEMLIMPVINGKEKAYKTNLPVI